MVASSRLQAKSGIPVSICIDFKVSFGSGRFEIQKLWSWSSPSKTATVFLPCRQRRICIVLSPPIVPLWVKFILILSYPLSHCVRLNPYRFAGVEESLLIFGCEFVHLIPASVRTPLRCFLLFRGLWPFRFPGL